MDEDVGATREALGHARDGLDAANGGGGYSLLAAQTPPTPGDDGLLGDGVGKAKAVEEKG